MEKDINQKLKRSHLAFIFIIPLLAFLISCNDDEDSSGPRGDGNSTILELAQSFDELSTFVSAASDYPEITSSLGSNSETYTLFAPTNDAFSVFMEAMGYSSLDDVPKDTLKKVIQYHIISGAELGSSDLTEDQTSETLLANESITLSLNGSTIMVNTSVVSEADIDASNGLIHIIDAVLIPAAIGGTGGATMMGVIKAAGQLSTLEEALNGYNDLVTMLDDASVSYTFFAPSNDAFEDMLTALGYSSLNEVPEDELKDILRYHLTQQAEFTAEEFTDGQSISTLLAEESLTAHVQGGSVAINSSSVISADVQATNGVVHVINAVLLPSSLRANLTSVLDLARENENLSLFTASFEQFPELRSVIDGFSGNYTIFAPTNAGFQTLLNITSQEEIEDVPKHVLKRFLQYHVTDRPITSAEFTAGSSLATLLEGESLSVSPDTIDGSGFLIDRSQLISMDMEADNGVLHVITGFLFPSKEASTVNTIMEPIYFNSDFNTLNAAIEKAGMFNYFIARPNNYTFFAPNNAGFENAGISSLEGLSAESLITILQYHIHEDSAYTVATLQQQQTLSTESGALQVSTGSNGEVILNDVSQVVKEDIVNNNGITHIIDHVLIPEN